MGRFLLAYQGRWIQHLAHYYVIACTTLLSAILGILFSVKAVREQSGTGKANAPYMFARSVALGGAAAIPIFFTLPGLLTVLTAMMLTVQLIDGCVGILIRSRPRTTGPFCMAAIHALCLCFAYRLFY